MPGKDLLIEELKEAAANLSYYNAAEGDCWKQEAGGRAAANTRYQKAGKACFEAGIDPNEVLAGGGYLVSKLYNE